MITPREKEAIAKAAQKYCDYLDDDVQLRGFKDIASAGFAAGAEQLAEYWKAVGVAEYLEEKVIVAKSFGSHDAIANIQRSENTFRAKAEALLREIEGKA